MTSELSGTGAGEAMSEKHWVTVLIHAQHSRRRWRERWFPTKATIAREAAELAQAAKEHA